MSPSSKEGTLPSTSGIERVEVGSGKVEKSFVPVMKEGQKPAMGTPPDLLRFRLGNWQKSRSQRPLDD
jgi:hypothetical protein